MQLRPTPMTTTGMKRRIVSNTYYCKVFSLQQMAKRQ
jgi:hypothetical protein